MLPKRKLDPQASSEMEDSNLKNNAHVPDQHRDPLSENSSEPHIVVACPFCKTKFAVETSLIAAYETPKFHCSRCDSLFEMGQPASSKGDSLRNIDSSTKKRWVLNDDINGSYEGNDTSDRGGRYHSSRIERSDFTLGDQSLQGAKDPLDASAASGKVEGHAGLSLLGFRPTASRRQSSSLTRSEAQALVAGVTDQSKKGPSKDPFAVFGPSSDEQNSGPDKSQNIQTNIAPTVEIPKSATLKIESQQIELLPDDSKKGAKTRRFNIFNRTKRAPAVTQELRPALKSTRVDSTPKAPVLSRIASTRNAGLLKLTLPLLGAVGIVAITALAARLAPIEIDKTLSVLIPGIISGKQAELPPIELSVQGLNMQLERTATKETIPVIRGLINNSSDKTLEDVSIEALGFNAKGELLVRARAPLRSALSREKISDLPLETVRKFQNALSASDASIKPGEKVSFSIALFLKDAAPNEVTYFSARVFSIGKAR